MVNKADYAGLLRPLLVNALASADDTTLSRYLMANSNLPGPRGNLELADACATAIAGEAVLRAEATWRLSLRLAALTPDLAPANDPGEFVAFCGVRGIGATGAVSLAHLPAALGQLRAFASDPRWRLREGVAMAIQTLLLARPEPALAALRDWALSGEWLVMRAAAAGVAEPPLLKDAGLSASALDLHRTILTLLAAATERRSAEFKTLRQALGYSLSVVVAALPEAGFAYMRELANLARQQSDADLRWLLRENLKKARLAKPYDSEVASLAMTLDDGTKARREPS